MTTHEKELFREEALTAYPSSQSQTLILRQQPGFTACAYAFLIVFFALLVLVSLAPYGHRVVLEGVLMPQGGLIEVSTPARGLVAEITHKVGDFIEPGDTLVVLSHEQADGSGDSAEEKTSARLKEQLLHVHSEYLALQDEYALEKRRIVMQITAVDEQIELLARQSDLQTRQSQLAEETLKRYRSLHSQGFLPKALLNEHAQAYLFTLEKSQTLKRNVSKLIAERGALNQESDVYDTRARQAHSKMMQSRADTNRALIDIERDRRTTLTAPVSGRLAYLQVAVGQYAEKAAPILAIIPDGAELQGVFDVPSAASGMLRPGLDLHIHYAAYPHHRYGQHRGQIISVADAALPMPTPHAGASPSDPLYRVTARIPHQHMHYEHQSWALKAGMRVQAHAVIGRAPLYQRLLGPLRNIGDMLS